MARWRRNVHFKGEQTRSLEVETDLYQAIHHPLRGERTSLHVQSRMEIHVNPGFYVKTIREEKGSVWFRICRVGM